MTKPVDLTRIRAAEEDIADILRRPPEIRERTAEYFVREGEMDNPETFTINLALKVGQSVLDRADALRPKIAQDAAYRATGRLSRSAVLRLALLKGLDLLEEDYRHEPRQPEDRR
jgi:hypothetical protein